jgi:hypothetical protein
LELTLLGRFFFYTGKYLRGIIKPSAPPQVAAGLRVIGAQRNPNMFLKESLMF